MLRKKAFFTPWRAVLALGAILALGLFLNAPTALERTGEFSLREWLGLTPAAQGPQETTPAPRAATAATTAPAQAQDAAPVEFALDYHQLRALVQSLPGARQRTVLTRPEAFRALIQDELTVRSMVAMALANGARQHRPTALAIQRQEHLALQERLQAQYMGRHIPEDFPGEDEMRAYYDQDPSRFDIPQRTEVWQIFFPLPDPAEEPQVLASAREVLARILSGELRFADAATIYSGHLPSRYRGGYVGLLDIPDIDAELLSPLLSLAPDQPGGPVRGREGYHIILRGALHPEIRLDFARARQQVRERMLQERREALYRELTQQAAEQYPYHVAGMTVRQWWADMRTEAGITPPPDTP